MTVGLMPLTGIPLPFISYGGSAVLGNFIAVGVVLAIIRSDADLIEEKTSCHHDSWFLSVIYSYKGQQFLSLNL